MKTAANLAASVVCAGHDLLQQRTQRFAVLWRQVARYLVAESVHFQLQATEISKPALINRTWIWWTSNARRTSKRVSSLSALKAICQHNQHTISKARVDLENTNKRRGPVELDGREHANFLAKQQLDVAVHLLLFGCAIKNAIKNAIKSALETMVERTGLVLLLHITRSSCAATGRCRSSPRSCSCCRRCSPSSSTCSPWSSARCSW